MEHNWPFIDAKLWRDVGIVALKSRLTRARFYYKFYSFLMGKDLSYCIRAARFRRLSRDVARTKQIVNLYDKEELLLLYCRLDMCRRQYANDVCNRGTAGTFLGFKRTKNRTRNWRAKFYLSSSTYVHCSMKVWFFSPFSNLFHCNSTWTDLRCIHFVRMTSLRLSWPRFLQLVLFEASRYWTCPSGSTF